ncbi:hypothetical protein HOY80DRAFT_762625 [Tuber brumale]|nr:hypothetical protein HOY80DRAFT_762625 [Tuber brumale]
MDLALVRQVLATDPLNCVRGKTATKWTKVTTALNSLKPQPISCSAESCRQRVKKLVEIYKKEELASLRKSGTNKEFAEFELNMVELATRWDQSSTDLETRKLAQEKAIQLERNGKRVREDSMKGLVRRREKKEVDESGSDALRTGGAAPVKKKQKNEEVKKIDSILLEFTERLKSDKEELEEIERREDKKHEELMRSILGLTEEIRDQSEKRSYDAYLEREARKEELVLILEALRKDNEI